MNKIVLIAAIFLVQGCAGLISGPRNNVPVEEPDASEMDSVGQTAAAPGAAVDDESIQMQPVEPLPRDTDPGSVTTAGPAVLALLDNAAREQDAGNMANAAASIERALRLEPKNAVLWSRLAVIRLEQGNWQQAYVLANKSNSLGRNDVSLQIRNWRMIELAKTRQGDSEGAQAARSRVRALTRGP